MAWESPCGGEAAFSRQRRMLLRREQAAEASRRRMLIARSLTRKASGEAGAFPPGLERLAPRSEPAGCRCRSPGSHPGAAWNAIRESPIPSGARGDEFDGRHLDGEGGPSKKKGPLLDPPPRQWLWGRLSRPFRPRPVCRLFPQGIGLRPKPWAVFCRPVGPGERAPATTCRQIRTGSRVPRRRLRTSCRRRSRPCHSRCPSSETRACPIRPSRNRGSLRGRLAT